MNEKILKLERNFTLTKDLEMEIKSNNIEVARAHGNDDPEIPSIGHLCLWVAQQLLKL